MTKNNILTVVIIITVLIGTYFILSRPPQTSQAPTSELSSLSVSPSISPTMNQELKIEDLTVGTGPVAKAGDTVEVNYLGTLENGTKFDSSYDRNQTFSTQIGVGQVIKGWDQGIPGMKVGGKRRLTIPSTLGYGSQGAGNLIPPNATLIFEVELVAVK